VGQRVDKGQVLYEVETDKAVVEVEADAAGRLARIITAEGQSAAVLTPVAYLAESEADLESFLQAQGAVPAAAPAGPAEKPGPTARTSGSARTSPSSGATVAPGASAGRIKASPAARKLAESRGIELGTLGPGNGPQGRILSTDVPAAAPAGAAAAGADNVIRRPLSRIRKAIARSLTTSKQTVPHFYIELTLDAAPMMDFYRQEKAKYPLSVNDVILHACAAVLMEFPAFRRRLEGGQYAEYPSANIGVAIAMEDGLVVPIVEAAEKLTLEQTAAHMRRLVEAARAGRVDNAGNGVMTISNLGMFGAERFSAIINPPEASILAVGAVHEEPVVVNGAIQPGRRLTVTLSCDHRVVDGASAARFLARLKELLENKVR
jgi:pyruvate dehydrogenase E2 component (dihydrolipoamide acetyltransferase)